MANYPAVEAYYKAGDPRIHQHLDAMAAMLSEISGQIEVAQLEGFQKTRNSTVLADAAMRGIVPKASPARARIKIRNTADTGTYELESGRNILDSSGRWWEVVSAVSVNPGEEKTFEAIQQTTEIITHTVSNSYPFYAIEIPESEDGSSLCGLDLSDDQGNYYEYHDRYTNVSVNDKVFHVEADEKQRVYIRLGYEGIVGVQPKDGDKYRIKIYRSFGDIAVALNSSFAFDYARNALESSIELKMSEMIEAGQNPIGLTALRDLAKYPSVYDSNAVFLGEFDFLVRRNFPTLQFLSVWNELSEEIARGSNVDNINCLFIACLSEKGGEETSTTVTGLIEEDQLTETQKSIRRCIQYADNSYRVKFYKPVISKIQIKVNATVSTSYVASDVEKKIVETLLAEYGKESGGSRRGQQIPLYNHVYKLLREKVPALTDGDADWVVEIDNAGLGGQITNPEDWRYADEESIEVNVSTKNVMGRAWQ